jgi:carboxyl-terminal processing protease
MKLPRATSSLNILLIGLLLVGVVFLNGDNASVKADTDDVYKNIEIFAEVLRRIEQAYVEPQDPQKLIYGAIKGMVRSLDPHSSFMTKEEHRELMMETKGSFSGVGIEITIKDDTLTVVSPIEDTPAFKAGIKAGDKIIKIEGNSTKDMSLFDAVKYIRGPKGTKVKLTIMREGEEKPLDFAITRDVIPLKSVRYHLLTPDIGYARVLHFRTKTAEDLDAALRELEKGGPLKGLILDLRNNPGGLLMQAAEVADLFLDEGLIVSTRGRDSAQDMVLSAHKNDTQRSFPIIVLVNGGSASASEIVAGALQDNKRALILGTRTFGKGSVQTILPLSDGSGLRLTTARYYTPNGKSIQVDGITPDIELEFVPVPEDENDKEKKQRRFIREKDLMRHMENEKKEGEDTAEKVSEQDERVKKLLERDNQVKQALQLLKTWSIFSQIKSGA